MGRAAAILFASEGARVIGCDVNTESALETLRLVKASQGDMASMQPCDLTDAKQCQALVDFAVSTYGRIDVLFNNAAMAYFGWIDQMADEDWYKTITQELHLVFDKHWAMIAEREEDGEVVGVALTFPDINQVLAKMKGKLLPLGWWHFVNKGKIMDRVRVGYLGVKPEFQHTGVAARMYQLHFDAAEVRPQTGGEMGWILETNTPMNRGMEAMGGQIVKRYRIYERELGAGSAAGAD